MAVWLKQGLSYQHLDTYQSDLHEVAWLVLHCEDHSRIVVGAIYRPGSASEYDITLLNCLDNAIDRVRGLGSHLLLAGDFNVHNADWLSSTKTTHAGEVMEEICAGHHLTQHVNTLTRGQNALDLVISDLPGTVSFSTLPPLGRSDHCVVTADFKTAASLCEPPTTRQVCRYAHADWDRMRAHFCRIDWTAITSDCPKQCCMNISQTILDAMTQFIPSKKLTTSPSDPGWWTCT